MEKLDKKKFLTKYASVAVQNNTIDTSHYSKYNVKRGLRNDDGTGVLVGLTEVGEVHGYVVSEGEKVAVDGRLSYRGIDINEIVKNILHEKRHGFEETCFLLLFGYLPKKEELDSFVRMIGESRVLPHGFMEDMILKAPSRDIMNKLSRCVLASYSYDEEPEDGSIANILRQSIELIARFSTFVAYSYQVLRHVYYGESLYIHTPNPTYSTAENFLHLIRPDGKFTKMEADLLDLLLVLHAEHGGGNNSTFAIRVVSSADTDTYSAVTAALASLKGAKHGGANAEVMGMMDNIMENVKNWKDADEVYAYLSKILKKEVHDKSGLIYGIGHAVYTLSDPRAILLKEKARLLADEKGANDEFELYELIEELAPKAFREVKQSDKVVAANIDFYSGLVYKMMGLDPSLYTPLFAISRISGWAAHRIEEIVSGGRIIRPAYKYVLPKKSYTPLDER